MYFFLSSLYNRILYLEIGAKFACTFKENIVMDVYTNFYFFLLFSEETEMEVESPPEPPPQRTVMKHNTVPNRMMQQ